MEFLSLKINGTNINAPGGIPTGGIWETFNYIEKFIALLIIAGVILSLFYLVLGGLSYITSEGDKQKLAQAKNRITLAIVGLVVIMLSFFIVGLIYYFFRVGNSTGGGGRRADIKVHSPSNLASNWLLTNKN